MNLLGVQRNEWLTFQEKIKVHPSVAAFIKIPLAYNYALFNMELEYLHVFNEEYTSKKVQYTLKYHFSN